jgi:Mn-containing catalase
VVFEKAPKGVPPRDLPPQRAVFAPDYAPEEISEIATKLRQQAGLPKEPTGLVADLQAATRRSTKKANARPKTGSRQ